MTPTMSVETILDGWTNVRTYQSGSYWTVSGALNGHSHAGTGATAEEAAHKLVARLDKLEESKPDPLHEALARLEAANKELCAQLDAREPGEEGPPEELVEYVRENEAYGAAQERLLREYTGLTNRLVDSRLPALSDAERRKQERLHKHLDWLRGGAVDTI